MRLLILALFLLAGTAKAATVTLSAGYTATVSDFGCQTVVAAFLSTYAASSGDCSYQAAGPGTAIVFRNASGTALGTPTVSTVSGWVVPPTNGALQTQVNTLSTTVSGINTRVTSLESNVSGLETNFGWDSVAFDTAANGGFLVFVTGLAIGLVISVVRKMRI
ncbi:hypothetical protein LZ012_11365 [Dechloromonas sp. XY25]|uniref:Uncharacterized protein n=1 Tax=Dechloromonas hankyongensis TaxID=2908002 RepID=A0ABS9K327_9RHOO|nr:hypothetical protein [Dechloromonas hankyongensis]MCG2577591.1 hypothetical protein [Dechloromonas hankyongensis]